LFEEAENRKSKQKTQIRMIMKKITLLVASILLVGNVANAQALDKALTSQSHLQSGELSFSFSQMENLISTPDQMTVKAITITKPPEKEEL
jgi:hypothetical protein